MKEYQSQGYSKIKTNRIGELGSQKIPSQSNFWSQMFSTVGVFFAPKNVDRFYRVKRAPAKNLRLVQKNGSLMDFSYRLLISYKILDM